MERPAHIDEATLLEALKSGDESAFQGLVERYYASMLRVALMYVKDREAAEDVVQETWLAVLKGLDRFEGRSSFKTWLYTILTNRAKTRAVREGRYVPLVWSEADESQEFPAVSADHFIALDESGLKGHWNAQFLPQSWEGMPEQAFSSDELRRVVETAIESLPPNQAQVIRLRDVEGWDSVEVCNVLGISETNQRVLLHRARSKVRAALEQYWAG